MARPPDKVLRVTTKGRRRGADLETFLVARDLGFAGYRVESSAWPRQISARWRDELDLEGFPKPAADRVERRLSTNRGRGHGRVLKLYQDQTLVAFVSLHVEKGHVAVLYAASRGLEADRELQMRILLTHVGRLARARAGKLAKKAVLWLPFDDQQLRLARDLGFTSTYRRGSGRELPTLMRP